MTQIKSIIISLDSDLDELVPYLISEHPYIKEAMTNTSDLYDHIAKLPRNVLRDINHDRDTSVVSLIKTCTDKFWDDVTRGWVIKLTKYDVAITGSVVSTVIVTQHYKV